MRKPVVIATVLVLVGVVLIVRPSMLTGRPAGFCDGAVPVWYPSENGCSDMPSLLEHLWPPERWGAPTFCQGMCALPMGEMEEQERVRDEWSEAHPNAVADFLD